nr:RNA polymerase sigma factor [Anaerolineae bacterium]
YVPAVDQEHPMQQLWSMQAIQNWPLHLPLPRSIKDADDETLIHLITQGSQSESERALETIYARHHQDVWRYVRSKVGSPGDTDEIAAAVWLVVLEKIGDFTWTGVPIKSWLLSIAYRKVLEFSHRPQLVSLEQLKEERDQALQYIVTQLQLVEQPEARDPVTPDIKRQADELLHQLIGRLSKTERQIIMLIYFEAVENAAEVGKRLGINKNTIRVYHKRARDKLASCPELRQLIET